MSVENVKRWIASLPDSDSDTYSMSSYYGNPRHFNSASEAQAITLETLGFTVDAVKEQLLGMDEDLTDSEGNQYPDSFYEHMIEQAVAHVEKELDIVIRPRLVRDRLDYNQTEFNAYTFLQTTQRPIIQVDDLRLMFNNQSIVKYPDDWLKVKNRFGQIELSPTFLRQDTLQVSLQQNAFLANSNLNLGGYNANATRAPQMVGVSYYAGMLPVNPEDRGINQEWNIHPDLVAYIAKYATIEVLERWGRLIIGAGIAGFDIAIDGISSSVNSTQSAENTGSTADIKLLQEDMKSLRESLQSYYGRNIGSLF